LADRCGKTWGTANPSTIDKLFWKYMVMRGCNAFEARRLFNDEKDVYKDAEFEERDTPDWPFNPGWY